MTMSKKVKKTGGCLCGEVRFDANTVELDAHVCHCNMCQLWNGSPTISVHCGTDVSFSNEDSISIYKSCSWVELGFCKKCGSHIFYRLIDTGEYNIGTGTFDSADEIYLDQQIFIDEKPSFYSFENKTTDLTGAEVWAQYESEEK